MRRGHREDAERTGGYGRRLGYERTLEGRGRTGGYGRMRRGHREDAGRTGGRGEDGRTGGYGRTQGGCGEDKERTGGYGRRLGGQGEDMGWTQRGRGKRMLGERSEGEQRGMQGGCGLVERALGGHRKDVDRTGL